MATAASAAAAALMAPRQVLAADDADVLTPVYFGVGVSRRTVIVHHPVGIAYVCTKNDDQVSAHELLLLLLVLHLLLYEYSVSGTFNTSLLSRENVKF